MIYATLRRLGGQHPVSLLQAGCRGSAARRSQCRAGRRRLCALSVVERTCRLLPRPCLAVRSRVVAKGVGPGSERITRPSPAPVRPRRGRQVLGYSAGCQRSMNTLRRYGSGDSRTAWLFAAAVAASQPCAGPNGHCVSTAFAPHFGHRARRADGGLGRRLRRTPGTRLFSSWARFPVWRRRSRRTGCDAASTKAGSTRSG